MLKITDLRQLPLGAVGARGVFPWARIVEIEHGRLRLPALQLKDTIFIALERPDPAWVLPARLERVEIYDGTYPASMLYLRARAKAEGWP